MYFFETVCGIYLNSQARLRCRRCRLVCALYESWLELKMQFRSTTHKARVVSTILSVIFWLVCARAVLV